MEAADNASDAPENDPELNHTDTSGKTALLKRLADGRARAAKQRQEAGDPDNGDEYLTWHPVYDAAGTIVPSVLWPAFEYSKQIVALAGKMRAHATLIEYALQAKSGAEHVDVARVTQLFDEIHKILTRHRPLQVCLRCYHGAKGFQTTCECKGLGWLPLFAVTHPAAKKWRKESHKHYKKGLHSRQRFLRKFRQLLEQENISASDIAWTPSAIRWLPRIQQLTGIVQGSSRRRRLLPPSQYHEPPPPESHQTDQQSSPS